MVHVMEVVIATFTSPLILTPGKSTQSRNESLQQPLSGCRARLAPAMRTAALLHTPLQHHAPALRISSIRLIR